MTIDILFLGWLLVSTLGVIALWWGFETAAEWSRDDE